MPAPSSQQRSAQAENLRKMLLAMVDDIRVVLIKLAERTQALRFLDERRRARAPAKRRARVMDIYAPLANRLGVWQLKWELEDLSLRALEPAEYKRIARLHRRAPARPRALHPRGARAAARELAAVGIRRGSRPAGPKHIYSICNKMRRKQIGIDALYDIRAVRILVDSVRDCYTALGVVHHLWTPLPGEFDDYIAKPKANNYRSLHTAVIGPEGKPLEVQIRTREMHRHSEYGVAAHWRYKEGARRAARCGLRRQDRVAAPDARLEGRGRRIPANGSPAFRSSLFTDSIYVLTPQGKVVDLPRGATPIDFAYAVHTSLGHRCRGARVDGAMVPLDYALRNGQRVEIIAAKQGGPSRDWLNAELGYVQSHRARAKVRQWFKAQQLDETVAQGRVMVERELARLGQTALKLEAVAAKAGFAKTDELFAAFARDEIHSKQVQAAISAVAQPATARSCAGEPEVVMRRSRATGSGQGILVVGVDRLLTGLARCCKPAPPDPIVGFVTRGKGITIHRAACANVGAHPRARAGAADRGRLGRAARAAFPVDIVVEASDRQGLLRDISELLSREKINVTAVNTQTRQHQARMAFTLEVESVAQLKRALQLARDIPGVFAADRR